MLMLRCGIGKLQAGIARTTGGMAANAPFKHTQLKYTPICSPSRSVLELWKPSGSAKTGPFGIEESRLDGAFAAPASSDSGSSAVTLLSQQQESTAGIEVNCVLARLQDGSRLAHRIAYNRNVLQIRDSRPH